MPERIVDIEDVPAGTRCALCGHVNGDLQYSYANGERVGEGKPFSQPFYIVHEGTQDEHWVHVGCQWDLDWDRYREWQAREEHRLLYGPPSEGDAA